MQRIALVVLALAGVVAFICFWRPSPDGQQPVENAVSESTSQTADLVAERDRAFAEADYRVLFIGNSHTSYWDMPEIFKTLAESDGSERKVYVESQVGGAFLIDHAENPETLAAIEREGWDAIVLQALKYSTSGRYEYPTTGAAALANLGKAGGARVVMYPEWCRQGHPDEAPRIHALHTRLAEQHELEVAPVGLTWDVALAKHPELQLHDSDGNHCSPQGAYLTACVFYAHLMGKSPLGLPAPPHCNLSSGDSRHLQAVAWQSAKARTGETAGIVGGEAADSTPSPQLD